MMREQWERARQEWRQNRRLRVGALVVVAILGTHGALALGDRRSAMTEQFERDAALLARLESASREQAWPKRARQSEAALAALRDSMPSARTEGAAQADLQAWLMKQAAAANQQGPVVRIESTVDVPGHPGLWQVLARLDTTGTNLDLHPLLRSMAEGLPWVQVERAEVAEAQPMRAGVIVRAYYRRLAGNDGPARSISQSALAGPGVATPTAPAAPAAPVPAPPAGAAAQ